MLIPPLVITLILGGIAGWLASLLVTDEAAADLRRKPEDCGDITPFGTSLLDGCQRCSAFLSCRPCLRLTC